MSRKKKPSRRKPRLASAPTGPEPAGAESPADQETPPPPPAAQFPIWEFVALAGLVLYLLVFYATPLPHPAGGAESLTRFDLAVASMASVSAIPDSWCGGDPSSVDVWGRFVVVAMAAAMAAVAFACGWLVLSSTGAERGLSRLESFVFSLAVGLNFVSLFTLLVGLSGGLHNRLVFAIPAGVVVLSAAYRWATRWLAARAAATNDDVAAVAGGGPSDDLWLSRAWLWVVLPFVVVLLLGAILPPWDFDVREYHLQVPKEWYQAGHIGFLPHNAYGNMPLGPQILGIPAMALFGGDLDWWWGSLAGKTLLGMFAPLTSLALFAAGRRFFSASAGAVAALAYISIPWVGLVSMSGQVDAAWAFYVFAACYAGLIAVPMGAVFCVHSQADVEQESESGSESPASPCRASAAGSSVSWSHVLLTGFLAGAAVTCKYPSLVFVVLPLGIWVLAARHRPNWKAAAVFSVAVVVGCGLWLGKNGVLTGNPVYPLAAHVFDGKTRTPEKIAQWDRAHQVPQDAAGRRWSWSQAADAVGRAGWRSQWLSPLLIPFALLAVIVPPYRRSVFWFALLACWIFALWWAATHRIDRFLLPMFPLLALIAGVGAVWSRLPWWRLAVLAILILVLVTNLLLLPMLVDDRLLVDLDRLRDDPRRVNPVHQYLNRNVAAGDRALLVADAQAFDLAVPVLYNTCFDDCRLEQWMNGRNRRERCEALARHNIRYVYVHWGELARYRSPGNYGYSDFVTPEIIDELIDQGVLGEPVGEFDVYYGKLYPVVGFSKGGK